MSQPLLLSIPRICVTMAFDAVAIYCRCGGYTARQVWMVSIPILSSFTAIFTLSAFSAVNVPLTLHYYGWKEEANNIAGIVTGGLLRSGLLWVLLWQV
jgi:hypothetical protein